MSIRAIIVAAVLSTAGLAVAANAATVAPASTHAAKIAPTKAASAKVAAKPTVQKTSMHVKKKKHIRQPKPA